MRTINPFSYFIDYASQFPGFGGDRMSPDPNYCFHSQYESVRPGHAIYRLKLLGSKASNGELTVHLHAFRPGVGSSPSLAAGNRLNLESHGQDLAVSIPFHAISGVDYALYGFFSEPADLTVEGIEILLDEPEDGAEVEIPAPVSILAMPVDAPESGPATGLVHHGKTELANPVSQDCTWSQLGSRGTTAEQMAHWRDAICQSALPAYGATFAGLEGWVVGGVSSALHDALQAEPFALSFKEEAPSSGSGEFADFILWPDGPHVGDGAGARWDEVRTWLERLKIGGIAVVGLAYWPGVAQSGALCRNEVKQWVFRLIGMGYSIAPLGFADHADLALDDAGMAAACLIVRRQ